MEHKEVFDSYTYPEDGEYVIYYFEPFGRWYTGTFEYNGADNGVSGRNGFSTWHPEVKKWMKGE